MLFELALIAPVQVGLSRAVCGVWFVAFAKLPTENYLFYRLRYWESVLYTFILVHNTYVTVLNATVCYGIRTSVI